MNYRSLALGLVAVVFLGCDKKSTPAAMPELHSVKGKIFRGGNPVSGGYLTLRSDAHANYIVSAKVEQDGTFEAMTMDTTQKEGKRIPGAPAGTYRGEYGPPGSDQSIQPIPLKEPVIVQAGANELKIELPVKK